MLIITLYSNKGCQFLVQLFWNAFCNSFFIFSPTPTKPNVAGFSLSTQVLISSHWKSGGYRRRRLWPQGLARVLCGPKTTSSLHSSTFIFTTVGPPGPSMLLGHHRGEIISITDILPIRVKKKTNTKKCPQNIRKFKNSVKEKNKQQQKKRTMKSVVQKLVFKTQKSQENRNNTWRSCIHHVFCLSLFSCELKDECGFTTNIVFSL